jgi:predicted transposase YbfD/YdcC
MASSEIDHTPFLAQFEASFGDLSDPRQAKKVEHPLMNILLIGFCSLLCGAEGWREMELFGYSKRDLFDQLLDMKSGIPSSDTFRRVFSSLDPFEVGDCFKSWVKESYGELIEGDTIAIDGKALRGTRNQGAKHWSHLVHAWSSELGVCLAQHKVSNKSNEITAIPELLDSLAIQGCWITIDAIGCQLKILKQIREREADYLIGLKGNQDSLLEQAKKLADIQPSSDEAESMEKDHGRIESRRCEVISDLKWLDLEPEWEEAGIQSIVKIEATRQTAQKTSTETRFYICSGVLSAEEALKKTRGHWGIENQLHWQLDVAFKEDQCRIREGNADQNLAMFRKMALHLLKNGPYSKGGVKARMKRAAWDEEYLLDLILNLGYL